MLIAVRTPKENRKLGRVFNSSLPFAGAHRAICIAPSPEVRAVPEAVCALGGAAGYVDNQASTGSGAPAEISGQVVLREFQPVGLKLFPLFLLGAIAVADRELHQLERGGKVIGDSVHRLGRHHIVLEAQREQRRTVDTVGKVDRIEVTQHHHGVLDQVWTSRNIVADLRAGTGLHKQIAPLRSAESGHADCEQVGISGNRLCHQRQAAGEDLLPNEFRLTLDSHFVSSMILYRRYGQAPVRVVRKPEMGWFGYQQYFDRLDYLYVYPGDVDEEDQDRQLTREKRNQRFIRRATQHLRTGRNLLIAPEGRCSSTEDSPGTFRPGAFRLAAAADPEPLIVPIAVANFDKRLTRTTTAAIVFPPFRLSDRVADRKDEKSLLDFVNRLQEDYRDYVQQAISLAQG